MATVRFDGISKSYGSVQVLHGIDLAIADGEFIALVGPSGCGKSTTLRMLAGLETITAGEIAIGDRVVNGLEPAERGIAMVFQSYALYPHMTVAKNMGYALMVAGRPKNEIKERVGAAARILGLEALLERRPSDLSGGQRQRVAMGRAIVRRPEVFLFDEPLSNLDAKLRTQMRTEIKRIHREVGATTVYVTHDQVEAMTLADRIVVMKDGVIQQVGTPDEVYERPANAFVAAFIGAPPMNLAPGTVRDGTVEMEDGARVPLPRSQTVDAVDGREVLLGIRPDDIAPEGHGMDVTEPWTAESEVTIAEPLGPETLVFFPFAGSEWIAKMLRPRALRGGERLSMRFDLTRLHLFDAGTGERLSHGV